MKQSAACRQPFPTSLLAPSHTLPHTPTHTHTTPHLNGNLEGVPSSVKALKCSRSWLDVSGHADGFSARIKNRCRYTYHFTHATLIIRNTSTGACAVEYSYLATFHDQPAGPIGIGDRVGIFTSVFYHYRVMRINHSEMKRLHRHHSIILSLHETAHLNLNPKHDRKVGWP